MKVGQLQNKGNELFFISSGFNKTTQCVAYKRNIKVCSHNQRCCEKAIRIPALAIQHAMRMRRVVICGLSGPTVFPHIVS